jgi:hypothetical protein
VAAGSGGSGDPKSAGMDARETIDEFRELLLTLGDSIRNQTMTMIPVRAEEDMDKEKLTVDVRPVVKGTVRKPDGSVDRVDMPLVRKAPIHFQGAGRQDSSGGAGGAGGAGAGAGGGSKKGYMHTVPIKKGDEGMLVMSSRSIDNWHDKGEEENQISARVNDMSDGVFIPGLWSKPRAQELEGGADPDKAESRSVDGKHRRGIDESGDGSLYGTTEGSYTRKATKNIEDTASENTTRSTGRVETATAGKAIVKKAAKIFLNST